MIFFFYLQKFQLKFKYICINLNYLYGPYNNFIKDNSEINNLIYNIFNKKKENETLKINIDYQFKGNYIFINDIIQIIYLYIENEYLINNLIINLYDSNFNYTICDIVEIIKKSFSFNLKTEYYKKKKLFK